MPESDQKYFLRMFQHPLCCWKNYSVTYFLLPPIFILPDGTWGETIRKTAMLCCISAGGQMLSYISLSLNVSSRSLQDLEYKRDIVSLPFSFY